MAIDWEWWEDRFVRLLESRVAYSDAAHDLLHTRRVVTNARMLARAEHARLEVVVPAAWLHDCVSLPKDSRLRATASTLAARSATDFLREHGYPEAFLPAIEHAIEAHSFSARIEPRTVEAMVVQDADRLDALGAIGIARCMMLGGAMGKALYDPYQPFPTTRAADDGANIVDHFYVKLLTLADTMKTELGRIEAHARTEVMRQFLARLGREIGVEP